MALGLGACEVAGTDPAGPPARTEPGSTADVEVRAGPGSDATNPEAGSKRVGPEQALGPTCDRQGHTAAVDHAEQKAGKSIPYFVYLAYSTVESPYDVLMIESYQGDPYGGPSSPGSYDLAGTSYTDCGLCVLAGADCMGMRCNRAFLATAGTLEVTRWEGVGGRFTGTLQDVVLTEVTIHPETFVSTPVEGGETWCLDEYPFDRPIEDVGVIPPSHAAPECVPEGTGTGLGDNIADFALSNCYGEPFSLHEVCGSKAVWLVAVAAWCTACAEYAPTISAAWKELQSQGLEARLILGEDTYGGPPSLQECQSWAQTHQVDPAMVLVDHDGIASWATLFSYLDPYSTTIGLPWSAVLRGSNLEYVYCQTFGGNLIGVLGELLAGE
jgi:hypothetical protein